MITKFGKRFLTNFFAGNAGFNEKEFALGIGSTAASENNTRLDFEFFRIPIQYGSIDIETNNTLSNITARDGQSIITPGNTLYSVIYKSTIPQDLVGIIKEIAVYPTTQISNNSFASKNITFFEDTTEWVKVGGTTNPVLYPNDTIYSAKIGNNLTKIVNDGSTTSIEYKASIIQTDFSGYSENDSLALAYIKADTNLSSIRIKFYSSDTDYFYIDFSSTSGTILEGITWAATGYKIHLNNLSNLSSSGTPDIKNIKSIGVVVNCSLSSSPATVYFDALRINDEDTFDPLYGMVSRSVLATPITKIAGQQFDVEYRMGLTF